MEHQTTPSFEFKKPKEEPEDDIFPIFEDRHYNFVIPTLSDHQDVIALG